MKDVGYVLLSRLYFQGGNIIMHGIVMSCGPIQGVDKNHFDFQRIFV